MTYKSLSVRAVLLMLRTVMVATILQVYQNRTATSRNKHSTRAFLLRNPTGKSFRNPPTGLQLTVTGRALTTARVPEAMCKLA